MATLTFSARCPEAIGRGAWTSHDWYALFLLFAESCGIVGVGVLLYSLGPALGIVVLAGSLVAWSTVSNHLAATRAACRADEDGEHDGPSSSGGTPSDRAGTAWLKNDQPGGSATITGRPILRQCA